MQLPHRSALALFAATLPLLAGGQRMDDGSWVAGGYSYSDELGGFRIVSVDGTGTRADPVVLVEDLQSAGPVNTRHPRGRKDTAVRLQR